MSTAALAQPGLGRLVEFGRLLRRRGLPVGTGRILTFCRAVAALDRLDRTGVYWAGRVSMVARKEDLAAYDAAFQEWFPTRTRDVLSMVSGRDQQVPLPPELEVLLDVGVAEESSAPSAGSQDSSTMPWSSTTSSSGGAPMRWSWPVIMAITSRDRLGNHSAKAAS